MTRREKGLNKVKNTFEDTLQVIHERVRATENAYEAMAIDLGSLDSEEVEQFKTHKKVGVFMMGVQALLVALTLFNETLVVAEQLDS